MSPPRATFPGPSAVPSELAARRPSPGERSDEELMVAAGAGSREAFAVLTERYILRVTRYCTKVTREPHAGEELAQETFLQIWAHRGSYRPDRAFAILLFTVACNRCRNHRRSWRRRLRWELEDSSAVDLDAVPHQASGQLDQLLERERRRGVHEAVARLPAKLQEVLLLRFDQGLDYPEIAAILGRSETTIRSRAFHGLRRLREQLRGSQR